MVVEYGEVVASELKTGDFRVRLRQQGFFRMTKSVPSQPEFLLDNYSMETWPPIIKATLLQYAERCVINKLLVLQEFASPRNRFLTLSLDVLGYYRSFSVTWISYDSNGYEPALLRPQVKAWEVSLVLSRGQQHVTLFVFECNRLGSRTIIIIGTIPPLTAHLMQGRCGFVAYGPHFYLSTFSQPIVHIYYSRSPDSKSWLLKQEKKLNLHSAKPTTSWMLSSSQRCSAPAARISLLVNMRMRIPS
jgi:hypothetical protein